MNYDNAFRATYAQRNSVPRSSVSSATPQPVVLSATPYEFPDPGSIEPRPWLYGAHLLRKQVSLTIAPGGVGKSSLTIAEGLMMAADRDDLGKVHNGPHRVWLYNLEDPIDELQRRIAGTMQHHGIHKDALAERLFVDSGRDQELVIAKQIGNHAEVLTPVVDAMIKEINAREIDVLIIDPFVSSHLVSETDNGAIDSVAKTWVRISHECNIAIELVHHTRKLNREAASSESARGASSLVNAARSSRVLSKMSPEQRAEYGISGDHDHTYFSIDRDKSNLAMNSQKEWYRTVSVQLPNGDSVGAVERYKLPNVVDWTTRDQLLQIQEEIENGSDLIRYNHQADNWIGKLVAPIVGRNPKNERKCIQRIIDNWINEGALVKTDSPSKNGKRPPIVEVGSRV